MNAIWLLPMALGVPIALSAISALPLIRDRSLTLAVFAPLPGLLAALFAPRGERLVLPDFLLGLTLSLSEAGALFLGAASLLWFVAGIYSRHYMRGRDRAGNFALFWTLCMAGNLGVFIAADVITFYVAFTLVSLMAFPLVIHDRSPEALNAGVVYIVLALAGEACLLAGLLLASGAAGGAIAIDTLVKAIALSPDRPVVLGLLVAGFGIKAGLFPFHVWLPIAHPAAPVPASAVLSGAIVKAGLFGLLVFMPFGEPRLASAIMLCVLGFAGAFSAALYGLTQTDPKAVLAYSTVSQMGLMLAATGAGLAAGLEAAALMSPIAVYALHHGLAKGALFLGIGAMSASSGRAARRQRLALGAISLSIAGLPLTGGALAKLALKAPLGPASQLLVTVSAITTLLLLIHFIRTLRPARMGETRAPLIRSVPVAALGAAALVLPWTAWELTGLSPGYALDRANLINGALPLLIAAGAATLVRQARLAPPPAPQGDLLALVVAACQSTNRSRRYPLPGRLNALAQRPALPRWAELRHLVGFADKTESALAAALPFLLLVTTIILALLALDGTG